MSDNVIEFPQSGGPPELLVGPFEVWHVAVCGRLIPRLTGRRGPDGITLFVDNRFGGGPFSDRDAEQAAFLVAQALAIGSGYSNLEAPNKDMAFAGKAMCLGEMPNE